MNYYKIAFNWLFNTTEKKQSWTKARDQRRRFVHQPITFKVKMSFVSTRDKERHWEICSSLLRRRAGSFSAARASTRTLLHIQGC